jgi:hypothetical protein
MPKLQVIEIPEDQNIVACPICSTPAIDEDGLVSQPSCPHISFVYANGEAFEYDPEGLETRLQAEQDKADEDGEFFDPFETLLTICSSDLILSQVSEEMACGSLTFTTWIGIRETPRDSRSRCCLVGAASKTEFSSQDRDKYFNPTPVFIRWMQAHFKDKLICEIGAGVGHVSKALSEAGLRVTALDLAPRTASVSEFDVIKADSTHYPFEKDSVVMFCRPSHSGFVEKTLTKAIQSHVSHILYVGLTKNLQDDLGSLHDRFTKRRIGRVGHSGECVWELNVKRLRASVRRSIPRLSPYIVQ